MSSILCPRTSAIQFSPFSAAQLGHHSDPIMYSVGDCTSDGRKKSSKRLAEESLERGSKRSRTNQSSSEDSGQSVIVISSDSTSPNSGPLVSKAAFKAKYDEGKLLSEGGFGSVFAGHRRADNLPVAIKHIHDESSIELTTIELEGKSCKVPLEVALLLKLQPKEGETSAVVALLDWYYLDDELILVLERPVPCMDLTSYLYFEPDLLPENEAKILTRQLVDALIEVHSKGVFHNDIKMDNILIEAGSDVPRVRIIDFGCGEFLKERRYRTQQGTHCYTSPEWFRHRCYKAEPATVWQLGVTVFEMLHGRLPFKYQRDIVHKHPKINQSLSIDCQDFLMCCLVKRPQGRYTLEELRRHDWLE